MSLFINRLFRLLRDRRQTLLVWCVCFIALVTINIIINQQATIRRSVDLFFYDILLRYKPVIAEQQIVVIEIDDKSLADLGRWPWSRTTHAQLINQVNQGKPKAISLDIFFTEPSQNPQSDAQLANAFKNSSHVVLPVLLAPKNGGILDLSNLDDVVVYDPIPLFSKYVVSGHAGNQPDWDSVVRHVEAEIKIDGRSLQNVMSLVASQQMANERPMIPYRGMSDSFTHYSYVDVLKGHVPTQLFQDKYVLIGVSASGLGDIHRTPFGLMSGVEIHANILSSILKSDFITSVSPTTQLVVEILCISILMLSFFMLGERWHLLSLLTFIVFIVCLSVYLLYQQNTWFSPVVLVLLAVLAYTVWSGWQMYIAFRYLRLQLSHLVPELQENVESRWTYKFDKVQDIIQALNDAQTKQIQTDTNNRELIEFLSHDMRTPQVNILAAMSVFKKNPNYASINELFSEIELNVSNTLAYAQSLIEFNRIEKALLNSEELNLQHLISYACERIYIQAQRENMRIDFNCDIEVKSMAWVRADGALLERALLNLISNAIRYSPSGSVISIGLTIENERNEAFAVISVSDQGVGMDEKTKQLLLSGQGVKKTGKGIFDDGTMSLGIGWRIVYSIVVGKHQGRLDIDTKNNQGTTVFLKLPLSRWPHKS
ncbi:MAG: tmoS 1 [Burkholderiaceae bacterium]|nr:tmoS 1 [Burkholderiaceae bacterium]